MAWRDSGVHVSSASESGSTRLIRVVLALGEMVQAQATRSILEGKARRPATRSARAQAGEEQGAGAATSGAQEGGRGIGQEQAAMFRAKRAGAAADSEVATSSQSLLLKCKLDKESLELKDIGDAAEARKQALRLLRTAKAQSSPWRRAASLMGTMDWGLETRSKVGAALLRILLDTAMVDLDSEGKRKAPAFLHSYTAMKNSKQKYGVVEWHPQVRVHAALCRSLCI